MNDTKSRKAVYVRTGSGKPVSVTGILVYRNPFSSVLFETSVPFP